MANHLLTELVLVCLAATTISSYRLDGQAALKIRHDRQCEKCPPDSPELLSSPWYGTPAPQERNKRWTRYNRDTGVQESPKPVSESSTSVDSQEVRSSSSGGIDLSQVTFDENVKGDSKKSNKTKQRRHASKYQTEDVTSQRILVSTTNGNNERMEGRTFVLRRVEGTTPPTVVEDQSSSIQAIKYFARFDRLLTLWEEIQKFREEYSKKTIYEYLESAIHHIFQTIVFDHLPSLLLAREAAVTDKIGRSSRNGKRNCESSSSSMYDSEEKDDKPESSGAKISFPAIDDESEGEITMRSDSRPSEILQYSQEPRDFEAPNSDSRDLETKFRYGTVGASGNRHFRTNIHDDSQAYDNRQTSYGSLGEQETARLPREPIERFASGFHYRFPAATTDGEKTVYRRMAPIDNAKRSAKREALDEKPPVSRTDRDVPDDLVNSENSDKSVDHVGTRVSAIPKEHGKSARLARSATSEMNADDDLGKIEYSEVSERFGRSENTAILGEYENSEIKNEPETSERIARSQVSTKLEGPEKLKNLDEPEMSKINEKLRVPEKYKKLQESEKFFENPENLEKLIYEELEKLGGVEKLNDEDVELITMLLERLKNMESDAGTYTEVEPARITVIEKPLTIVTDKPTTEKSLTDSPPPSKPV